MDTQNIVFCNIEIKSKCKVVIHVNEKAVSTCLSNKGVTLYEGNVEIANFPQQFHEKCKVLGFRPGCGNYAFSITFCHSSLCK